MNNTIDLAIIATYLAFIVSLGMWVAISNRYPIAAPLSRGSDRLLVTTGKVANFKVV